MKPTETLRSIIICTILASIGIFLALCLLECRLAEAEQDDINYKDEKAQKEHKINTKENTINLNY